MLRGTRMSLTLLAAATVAGSLFAPAAASAAPLAHARPSPVRLIIDTDIYSDVDDAGALAIANAMVDSGEAKLLAVMVDTPSRWGAPAADAINTYYHHGSVPVGTLKPVDDSVFDHNYAQVLAQQYPNSLKDGTRAPEAVGLYRKVLAQQPDHSVTIASVGFFTNLARLLDSGPDHFSKLAGRDLIAQKVKRLVVMGGAYPSGREFNFFSDVPATKHVVNDWPTEQVYSGFEVGVSVYTGARLSQAPVDDPVRRAYEIYVGAGNNRNSWDPTAVYYAIRGGDGLFTESTGTGSIEVLADGSDRWVPGTTRSQHYLIKTASDATIARVLEDLMLQRPTHIR
ncbi:MAG: Inosine-uridine preferring nucleoside hydrolase 3 [Sphaerisporangium sp.]|jgi:inosine-uridine nucleoside N-ribohydrolase|nr:Inosine-uridine preferring nucleoside hydrolase 3 [Sphaerisporangium sp.]